jgi:uncharacterized protein (TIRG00374 family)
MKKKLLAGLQLVIGIAIVIALLGRINKNSKLIEFTVPKASVEVGTIYGIATNPACQFLVKAPLVDGTVLKALPLSKPAQAAAESVESDVLTRIQGQGPDSLRWSSRLLVPYGFRLIGETFRMAAEHWPLLLTGFLIFFVCLLLCAYRWQLLLRAQDLNLSFGRVLMLYFVGNFFNTMLPGVTGGDLVKAIYAAHEAPHKKTAAVSTVVIDRIVGLIALILLTVVIMLIRLPLFLSSPPMKIALVLNMSLLVVTILGFFVLFRRNLLEHWAFFKRLEERTALGEIIGKAYNAFHVCMTHPVLLAKTLLISVINHLTYVVMIYFMGRALGINLSFFDYVTAFLIINAVAAIPLTPGGMGVREGMAIFILAVFGIAAAGAFSISITIYASIIGWGLISGVVYLFYIYGSEENPKDALSSSTSP